MLSLKRAQPCWILIADGGRARIVVRAAHDRSYETVRSIESAATEKRSVELGNECPGPRGGSGSLAS